MIQNTVKLAISQNPKNHEGDEVFLEEEAPSKVTTWIWERKGRFPKQIAIDPGTKRWIDSEIDVFLAARAVEQTKFAGRKVQ